MNPPKKQTTARALTRKQEAFCRYYVSEGFNGSEAARRAKYAEESVTVEATRLLAKASIQKRIEELTESTVKRSNATADELFEFLTFALNFDPTVWVNITATGLMVLKCDSDQLPKMVRKMIVGTKPTKFGVQVDWFSKERAADMLSRYHGMYKDQLRVTTTVEDLSDEELEAELKALDGNE